jgi:hypothetical protein
MAGKPVEIRAGYLPNTSAQRRHYTDILGVVQWLLTAVEPAVVLGKGKVAPVLF